MPADLVSSLRLPRALSHRPWLALLVLCIVGAGILSVRMGQDANWDLMNYHVYNAWAALNGRSRTDLFVSGIQSYLNPALDVPYYLAAFDWLPDHPRWVAFVAGLPFGLLTCLAVFCAHAVLAELRLPKGQFYVATAAAAAFGMSGGATLPQIGTTFNEIQVAVLVVAGVALVLSALRGSASPHWKAIMGCGGLLGLAAGLKLTAGLYAPAVAVALFAVSRDWKNGLRAMAVFSLSWAVAFCASYGWWGAHLYSLLGNPAFPMLEGVFGTHWFSAGTWMDDSFKPKSTLQALFYPFYWIRATSRTVAEPVFSDPRFAIALVAMAALAMARLVGRVTPTRNSGERAVPVRMPPNARFLLVFLAVAYVAWLAAFSILRYAVSIEVLLGPAVVVALVMASRALRIHVPAGVWLSLLVLSTIFVTRETHYPRWGRVHYSNTVLAIDPVSLEPNSMLILRRSPQGYVVPLIARQNPTARFVGLTDELYAARKFGLFEEAAKRVREFQGPQYAMVRMDDTVPSFEALAEFGLAPEKSTCRVFRSSIETAGGFRICRLRRTTSN